MNGFATTRGGLPVSLEEAVFQGLAADGGLFVPMVMPSLTWPPPGRGGATLDDLRPVSRWAAPAFFPSQSPALLSRVVDHALDFPIPMREVETGLWVLELFHGPTHAFKDVGARFMAALMSELEPGGDRRRTVLVATSGDTGGAVASAFHGLDRYDVIALFPRDGISERQRRQMTTLGDNVHALAVAGTFDDCQRMVKEAFRDRMLGERHGLTSANSINVARLLPQSFYYLHAARLLGLRAATGADAEPDGGEARAPRFVVPCGNLGNLCAGLIAARAGMPTSGFIAATNENRGFVDYLQGGTFEPKPSIRTTSSAMDVGDPSNLERIRWLYAEDHEAIRRDVRGVAIGETDVARCIRELYEVTGYVADPHTAVAYAASRRHNAAADGPVVVLATAHPAKFPETVETAIGHEIPLPPGLQATQERDESMREIAAASTALRDVLDELHR